MPISKPFRLTKRRALLLIGVAVMIFGAIWAYAHSLPTPAEAWVLEDGEKARKYLQQVQKDDQMKQHPELIRKFEEQEKLVNEKQQDLKRKVREERMREFWKHFRPHLLVGSLFVASSIFLGRPEQKHRETKPENIVA